MRDFHRREILSRTAFGAMARAGTIQGAVPWAPAAGAPPQPVLPGHWHFFTSEEGRAIEAIVDRMIPRHRLDARTTTDAGELRRGRLVGGRSLSRWRRPESTWRDLLAMGETPLAATVRSVGAIGRQGV